MGNGDTRLPMTQEQEDKVCWKAMYEHEIREIHKQITRVEDLRDELD